MSTNNKSSDSFVNDCNNLSMNARRISARLNDFSSAFYVTGNHVMAEKLARLAEEMAVMSEDIRNICSTKIQRDYLGSIQNVADTLKTFSDYLQKGTVDT